MGEISNNGGYLTPSNLTGKRAPDYGGKLKVSGEMYWVSGWKIEKDGREYISIQLKKNTTYQAEKRQRRVSLAEF